MTRRRSYKPETVAFEHVTALMGDTIRIWTALGLELPPTVRLWRRRDGGLTIRVVTRRPDGLNVSSVVKLRQGRG